MVLREEVYGPILEEIIYRGFLLVILENSGYNLFVSIFISSFLFGISHLRHLWEEYDDVKVSTNQILVQVGFTTFFALYNCIYFCITNNLIACILVHSSCNLFGLPNLRYLKLDDLTLKISKKYCFIPIFNFLSILLN